MAAEVSSPGVPYPSLVHPQAIPDRLAAMALLSGRLPRAIERCRYLDIGCADALNLISVAYAWPDCECVGIDVDESAIARGRQMIEQLGLKNIRLIVADVCDASPDLGTFDYIAAHGIYSWVPEHVRSSMFMLLSQQLAPGGLAYVSYDVYPGAMFKGAMREMMLSHLGAPPRDLADVARARASLKELEAVATDANWANLLRTQNQRLAAISDASLINDDLVPEWQPVWFETFINEASSHGFTFVCEADPADVYHHRLSPQASAYVRQAEAAGRTSHIAREAALDRVRGRAFRQSILARANETNGDSVQKQDRAMLDATASLREDPGKGVNGEVTFRGRGEGSITVIEPSVVAALRVLSESWPAAISMEELNTASAHRAGLADDLRHAQIVLEVVKGIVAAGLGEVHAARLPCAATLAEAGEHPRASTLARLLNKSGTNVVTLHGHRAEIRGEAGRTLLELLDGTRTIAQITTEMQSRARSLGARIEPAEIESQINAMVALRLIHRG